jgi:hypothetical protein
MYLPGFLIRIHLIRALIQHFRLNTDQDPVFYDQNLKKKFTAEQKIKVCLDQKLQFTYP